MAFIIADRVRETTTTSGTGDIYLAGAVSGFIPFSSVLITGSTTYYAVISSNGSAWEVGVGTYTSLTNTLARTTILASSNNNAIVNFGAGTKSVILTQPAERNVYVNDAGVVVSGDNGSNLTLTNATLNNPTINGGTNVFTSITDSGNLIFTGTGNRITGDFTNSTVANRVAFQTSTVNSSTGIYALPNGTSTAASWQAVNAADPTNASKVLIATNGSTDVQLVSGINGTGTYLPLSFYLSGTQKMQLDINGLLGLGVTPTASKGTLQVGAISYTDTGVVAGFASSVAGYNQVVLQNTSNDVAASTNFNISNDAGTASTNFGELGINSSTFTGTGSFSQAGNVYLASASTDLVIGTYASKPIRFVVNSGATDAVLIDANGSVGVGASTLTGYDLRVSKNITGATTAYGAVVDATIQSDVTATAYGYSTGVSTAATSFTLTSLNHYRASQGTIGAGSTVTNQYGFVADATLIGATNNYGYFGGVPISAGANRYNLYMGGTAPNYLAGGIEQANTISSNYTITAGTNSQWITPLSISATVTIPSTSSWTLI